MNILKEILIPFLSVLLGGVVSFYSTYLLSKDEKIYNSQVTSYSKLRALKTVLVQLEYNFHRMNTDSKYFKYKYQLSRNPDDKAQYEKAHQASFDLSLQTSEVKESISEYMALIQISFPGDVRIDSAVEAYFNNKMVYPRTWPDNFKYHREVDDYYEKELDSLFDYVKATYTPNIDKVISVSKDKYVRKERKKFYEFWKFE